MRTDEVLLKPTFHLKFVGLLEGVSMTSNAKNFVLSVDEFVRSIEINRNIPHAVLLGAGASISSGVKSANACIWEWKRDIFLTRNLGLEAQFQDSSIPSVQQKIQEWLNAEGTFPPARSSEEYGFYVEKCYPISQDRRQYFQKLAEHAKPFMGYQLLCLLAEAGIVNSVWTTNFDGLMVKSAHNTNLIIIEVGLDSAQRIVDPIIRTRN